MENRLSVYPNDYLKAEAGVIVIVRRTSDKTSQQKMEPLCYLVEKIETKKEYNEFHVLGTHMSVLIYNAKDIQ